MNNMTSSITWLLEVTGSLFRGKSTSVRVCSHDEPWSVIDQLATDVNTRTVRGYEVETKWVAVSATEERREQAVIALIATRI